MIEYVFYQKQVLVSVMSFLYPNEWVSTMLGVNSNFQDSSIYTNSLRISYIQKCRVKERKIAFRHVSSVIFHGRTKSNDKLPNIPFVLSRLVCSFL